MWKFQRKMFWDGGLTVGGGPEALSCVFSVLLVQRGSILTEFCVEEETVLLEEAGPQSRVQAVLSSLRFWDELGPVIGKVLFEL